MIYTVPHYYNHFKCIASECPDTCCAGWGIMIDRASLKKYREMDGPFGSRLHNSIHWKEGSFKQYRGRCAFLNEENLCDIYSEAGPEYLCRTCRTYPRHIEEFEGCREMTLCLSCIEAARIILGCEEPVRFITREDEREETYEEFDFFLYTKLMDARELALDILRNRTWSWADTTSLCLGLAHDLQARIRKGRLYAYFCGAVYNENPYGKMKMAAAATLLIEELAQALWTDQGGRLSFMDFVDAAHRFSREVEHSDFNKAVLEEAMVKRPGFALRRLLAAVNSDGSGQGGERDCGQGSAPGGDRAVNSQKTMDNIEKWIYN